MTKGLAWLVVLCALGCPAQTDRKSAPRGAASCTRVGDSCEFAPGKLGTCVRRDDCAVEPCLTCQSQH